MPYKCVHCNEIHPDNSPALLNGCVKCKSKFFFYIKEEKLKQILANPSEDIVLSEPEKAQAEKDVREIAGIPDEEVPVFLDFESVKVIKPGKYAIDLTKLFEKNKPRVYKLEDGKYFIDLNTMIKQKQEEE